VCRRCTLAAFSGVDRCSCAALRVVVTGPNSIQLPQRPDVTLPPAALLLLLHFEPQVTLATDLLYHWASREATATVGYDVTLRQARLQGKIDSAGRVDVCRNASVMQRTSSVWFVGAAMLLSAELDTATDYIVMLSTLYAVTVCVTFVLQVLSAATSWSALPPASTSC
jgi:hypothetical protein